MLIKYKPRDKNKELYSLYILNSVRIYGLFEINHFFLNYSLGNKSRKNASFLIMNIFFSIMILKSEKKTRIIYFIYKL